MHPSSWKWQLRCLSTETRKSKRRQNKKVKKTVDLVAAALNGWRRHSSSGDRGQGRGKGGLPGNCPQAWPQ
jgi:hypothetical protein